MHSSTVNIKNLCMDPEKSRRDPGRIPDRSRKDPGRIPEGSRKDPGADPGRIPEGSRRNPGRIPDGSRKDPGETPEISMKVTHWGGGAFTIKSWSNF